MAVLLECANCTNRACVKGGEYPAGCPTSIKAEVIGSAVAHTAGDSLDCKVMAAAEKTPRREDGSLRTRLEELVAFCKEAGFSTIGVAFCIALAKEAHVLCDYLSDAGLTVVPVCCKVGSAKLSDLGVESKSSRVTCNPVSQAAILNSYNTHLNVIAGLCLGHDMLFTRHSDSLVTTFVVKDRALGHNPIQALRDS